MKKMNTQFLTPTKEMININNELQEVHKKISQRGNHDDLMEICLEKQQETVKQNV
jgi:hypothetical protein